MRDISAKTRSCGSADICVPSLFLPPDYAASPIGTSRTIHVLQGLGYAVTQTDGDNAMTHAEPAGLMAFWADIDPDYEMRFLEWHNCEHMPERVSVPGFREGRRYRSIGNAPRYLMMYLTESADVLSSDGYMERLNDPTPWTRESLGHFRRPSRNVYTLLSTCGDTSLRESPYLVSIRFDIAPEAGNRIRSSIPERAPARLGPPFPRPVGRSSTASTPLSPASRRPSAAFTKGGRARSDFCFSPNARSPERSIPRTGRRCGSTWTRA